MFAPLFFLVVLSLMGYLALITGHLVVLILLSVLWLMMLSKMVEYIDDKLGDP